MSLPARLRVIVKLSKKNIIPKLGHVPVRKLTAVHIEAFEAELQREGWWKARATQRSRKVNKPQSRRSAVYQHRPRYMFTARFLSARPCRAAWCPIQTPARQVKPPRPHANRDPDTRQDEITTLLNAAKGVDLYVPILVAVTTGMRRGSFWLCAGLTSTQGSATDG